MEVSQKRIKKRKKCKSPLSNGTNLIEKSPTTEIKLFLW
jgi:hypothetical protein